jgi:hypothetical protein
MIKKKYHKYFTGWKQLHKIGFVKRKTFKSHIQNRNFREKEKPEKRIKNFGKGKTWKKKQKDEESDSQNGIKSGNRNKG